MYVHNKAKAAQSILPNTKLMLLTTNLTLRLELVLTRVGVCQRFIRVRKNSFLMFRS